MFTVSVRMNCNKFSNWATGQGKGYKTEVTYRCAHHCVGFATARLPICKYTRIISLKSTFNHISSQIIVHLKY